VAYDEFADYTGNLADDPRVTLVHDEARSWLARTETSFDVIQLSLTDTWAATAAGAFVLAENSLYTVEAWRLLLGRLTDAGVATCSRWYFQERPGEIYRLVALAARALADLGVEDPRRHMLLVRTMFEEQSPIGGLGTLLVSRTPFTEADVRRVEDVAGQLQFEVMLTPERTPDPTLAALASAHELDAFAAAFPIDISPPTDDRPFFFQMLRLRDVFDRDVLAEEIGRVNMQAVFVLAALLATVLVLTGICIVAPLLLSRRGVVTRDAVPLLLFFAAIGFGFMLIEVSQMQRLTIFLGHPTYGLSVVLFSLLLSGGLGSWLTRSVGSRTVARSGALRLGALLVVAALFGILTPIAIRGFAGAGNAVRIGVAVAILAPLGLFLGMAFPLGMTIASGRWSRLTPWLWGVNGATSVCASVLAVVVALGWGISAVFWAGCACYVVALLAFVGAGRVRT
jgi:hypothetical protein